MPLATDPWICTHCGFYSPKRFSDDICPLCQDTDWFCRDCGYTVTASASPGSCHGCQADDRFVNITSYVPE